MCLKIKQFAVPFLLFIFLSAPAYPVTPIYMWKDSNGVTAYGDDPANAPDGAKVTVWSESSNVQKVSEAELTNVETNDTTDHQPGKITEGAFAVQLVKELGLSKNASPRKASEILSGVRIAPPQGRWELSQPMTPELALRLRQLTVAAANEGWIKIPEDQALLAFDTAAAVLGLNIPLSGPPLSGETSSTEAPALSPREPASVEPPSTPAPPDETYPEEEPAVPAGPTPDVIYSTYPILAAPPLITFITPFPAFYPYYTWYPVAGGFWCNNFFYPGYYVLNSNLYFHDHFGFHHGRRFIGPSPRTIGGQIQGRIVNGHFQNLPNARQIRSGVTSVPAIHSTLNPSLSPNRSLVSAGRSYTRPSQSRNTSFSSPSRMTSVPRLQPNSFRAFHRASSFGPSYPSPSVYHRYAFSAPTRTFSAPRSFSAPTGRGFFSGSARQSVGRSSNGFRGR